jgi:hypothetical protein
MMDKADSLSYELAALRGKLAVANAVNTILYSGNFGGKSDLKEISLAHAISILQELKGRIAWVKGLPCQSVSKISGSSQEWDESAEKYINKPFITFCNLPEAKRAALVDALQEEFDLLNGAVESINQMVKITI